MPDPDDTDQDNEPTLGLDDRIDAYLKFRTGRDVHDGGNVEKLRELAKTDEGRRTGARELLAEFDAEQKRIEEERVKREQEAEEARLTDEREQIKADLQKKLQEDMERSRREALEAEVRAELAASGVDPDNPGEVMLLQEFGEKSTAFNQELKRLQDAEADSHDPVTRQQLRDEIERLIDEQGPRLDEISGQLSAGRTGGKLDVDVSEFDKEFNEVYR